MTDMGPATVALPLRRNHVALLITLGLVAVWSWIEPKDPLTWWLVALIVLSCLGISAFYELIEFAAGVASSEAAEAFLGTQGDNRDTQKDMLLAMIGAISALVLCSRLHDRQLVRLCAQVYSAALRETSGARPNRALSSP